MTYKIRDRFIIIKSFNYEDYQYDRGARGRIEMKDTRQNRYYYQTKMDYITPNNAILTKNSGDSSWWITKYMLERYSEPL